MPDPRTVFVIHGRDAEARRAVDGLLKALDLRPLDWEEIVRRTGSGAPFIGDILAKAFEDVQAAVVLLTPDDIASLHPDLHDPRDPEHETRPTGQARPDVLFEAGMALALHPTRTVLVEIGELRPFSDIGGRDVVRLDGTVKRLHVFVERLRIAGCAVDTTGADWLDNRPFTGLSAYTRTP
ncbi:nucleotide-binding protein [Dactylosporangium sp. AC04546]|uniref:TIR domain-containing protein n=1 Tax=Dactylosporangium sp. AC04546 TaxID=2862460 RepID=UPI001EDF97E8|nr:nucleotide-binding protein [Dactylosporangium sp. AC04546]WVK88659.1 nucleotide-binding protein [Dactylosporangium sp. AC04546]